MRQKQKRLADKAYKELKRKFPLPKYVIVLDTNNKSLESKAYELIESWFVNQMLPTSYDYNNFFGFSTPELRTEWLPQLNAVLNMVGLVAVPDAEQLECVSVRPRVLPRKYRKKLAQEKIK